METKKSLSGFRTTGDYDSKKKKRSTVKKIPKITIEEEELMCQNAIVCKPPISGGYIDLGKKDKLFFSYRKTGNNIFYHPVIKKYVQYTEWCEGKPLGKYRKDECVYDALNHPEIKELLIFVPDRK